MSDLFPMLLFFGHACLYAMLWYMLSSVGICVRALVRDTNAANVSNRQALRDIQHALKAISSAQRTLCEIDVYSYDANTGEWGTELIGTYSVIAVPAIESHIYLGEDANEEDITCLVAEVVYTRYGVKCAVMITSAEQAALE